MLEIKNLSFTYLNGIDKNGINNINLSIKKGEVVLLCGESGCGKTTLTRFFNGLIPNFYEGEITGSVKYNEIETGVLELYEIGKVVGSVFQNPKSQFFNVDTASEIVFGCENQGMSEVEIKRRFNSTVEDFKLEPLVDRNIFNLSGGEKQKIACASVSAMDPEIIVLDEPSSSLDTFAIEDLAKMINFWKRSGKTVIIAEHRLYFLRELVDKVVYMKDGRILYKYNAHEFKNINRKSMEDHGLRPLYLENLVCNSIFYPEIKNNKCMNLLNFKYSFRETGQVLNIKSLDIPLNSASAIIGKNGSGKTTFVRCLCGLNRKFKGTLEKEGMVLKGKTLLDNCYMVMQDVNHQLFSETVLDEVLLSMDDENLKKAKEILVKLDLIHLKDVHPLSLSGGQKQRVAIAGAVASRKDIIVFDEPTSGLDLKHMKEVSRIINSLTRDGKTILIISHDLEFIMECCTNIIHLDKGKVIDTYNLNENNLDRLKLTFTGNTMNKEILYV